jgi:hypothetical protein
MIQKYEVLECEETGTPYVSVPGEKIWDLTEFFSWQRVRAEYDYETTHCRVYFLFLDRLTAQHHMDEWALRAALDDERRAGRRKAWVGAD